MGDRVKPIPGAVGHGADMLLPCEERKHMFFTRLDRPWPNHQLSHRRDASKADKAQDTGGLDSSPGAPLPNPDCQFCAPPPRCHRPRTSSSDRIPYTVLLLLWGGIFGVWYTETTNRDPFNQALNNVRVSGVRRELRHRLGAMRVDKDHH